MDDRDLDNLGFTYRASKNGEVHIARHGRTVATLRGKAASAFLADAKSASEDEQQHLMARMTGNYRRGNEHTARTDRRDRR
jgi:hypothetical protein